MSKIKVKSNAWHMKLYNLARQSWDDNPFAIFEILFKRKTLATHYRPKSLCSYFWFTFFSLLALPLVIALLGAIIAICAIPGYFIIKYLDARDERRMKYEAELADRYNKGEISADQYHELAINPKGDSILLSFLRAKKDKVCPMIEVIDVQK